MNTGRMNMETLETPEPVAREANEDVALLRKMAASWPKRATVRGDLYRYAAEYVDPARPDYPHELIPFRDHPKYLALTPEARRRINSWAWLVYNERTIQSEEYLANPAFTLIMHGAFPGADEIALRQAMQQCLIDEHFHTLIHLTAIHESRRWRALDEQLDAPLTLAYRRLAAAQAQATEPWQKHALQLVFGVVAEVCIKGYLNLIAENETIQPMHRIVSLVHNRDEAAHGQILVPVTKLLWRRMNEPQRRFFMEALPGALTAFAAHDFSAWRAILLHERVAGADEVIADCEREAAEKKRMLRDVSVLKKLTDELGITDQIQFEFGFGVSG
jgi:hypothetical protein